MVHLCTLWIGRPEIAKWRPSRLRLLEDKPANDLPNGFHQGGCIVTATERQRNCVPSAHLRSSHLTVCKIPFTVKSIDSGSIFTRSPVRTCPDFNLIQTCLAGFCSGDFCSLSCTGFCSGDFCSLSCAGEMGASNMVAINITIRVNGFMAPPFARATFYPRHNPRSTS